MSRLTQTLLPLSLLTFTIYSGCSAFCAPHVDPPAGNQNASSRTAASPLINRKNLSAANSLDRLCRNHYNQLHLDVGKFEQVKAIIDRNKKASVTEIKTSLNAKGITLYEASWSLYYLGQKSLDENDFPNFVKYLTVAADDYLNPWAMVKLAKVYYYDKAQWKKDFPTANITTDKDLERSYIYLSLAFLISGEIEKAHQDNFLLTGVANGGLALKDTFEGRGVSGFDARKALQKHQQEMLTKAEAYKKMYGKG